ARHQKVRHIQARDQQDQPDDGHQDLERLRELTAELIETLPSWFHFEGGSRDRSPHVFREVGAGFVSLKLTPEKRQSGAGLIRRDAWFAPPHDRDPPGVIFRQPGTSSQYGWLHHHWNPDVDGSAHRYA